MKKYFLIFLLSSPLFSQTNNVKISSILNIEKDSLHSNQIIHYYNNSKDTLNFLYFHNWINSYKNQKTPLAKRLLRDYSSKFYFSKDVEKGNRNINYVVINNDTVKLDEIKYDILKVFLAKNLLPNDSVKIKIKSSIKIPSNEFTGYGISKDKSIIHLKYWYLSPVVYENKEWQLQHHLNLDDLYENLTAFNLKLTIPSNYYLYSNLTKTQRDASTFTLVGNNLSSPELYITKNQPIKSFKTKNIDVLSDLPSTKLQFNESTTILNRQIQFIEKYIGKTELKKLLISYSDYKKNPVYGFNQLPKFLNPFNDVFEFDIQHFKMISKKIIDSKLHNNLRRDYWLNDGLQNYLMMKYVEKYYPEIKTVGKISNLWGIKNYQFSKINFNEKYAFVYQFAASKNLDQSLNTRKDSLSTFNRKIVNKFKAGLGLKYLEHYIGEENLIKAVNQTFLRKKPMSIHFVTNLNKITNKNIKWFTDNYIKTSNKIDTKIKSIKAFNDSLSIKLKQLEKLKSPLHITGFNKNKIIYEKWFDNKSNIIKIKKDSIDKIALNYKYLYPEVNRRNNWKKVTSNFINRPIQFKFFKDIENPDLNQLFYNFYANYNYYDGFIFGPKFYNKALFKKKWLYNITPTFSTKSKSISGSGSILFTNYYQNKAIDNINFGITGSNFHYKPDLSYNRMVPFFNIYFKRNSLREATIKKLSTRFIYIDKEKYNNQTKSEEDNYKVLNFRYMYDKPEVNKHISFSSDLQLSEKFSKFYISGFYRYINTKRRIFQSRLYFGSFITNKTESNYFDFSLNKPSDYLFDYNYLGRSESTGFLNQQFIPAEGSFKSFFNQNTANQWILTSNNKISMYKFINVYGDLGYLKNKKNKSKFYYDTGINLDIVPDFLSFYFPVQSSNGFELNDKKYQEKIRFLITLNPGRIYNYLKRGFY